MAVDFSAGEANRESPLQRLNALVVPPAGGGNAVDWDAMSSHYSHGFPGDYVQFVSVYGEGVFDDFISIYGPTSEVYPEDPGATVAGLTGDARFTAQEEGFEEPDLLIGWGLTTDSDLLCWYTGDPKEDQWTTVIWRRNWAPPDSWMRFDCGMVELLCRYVEREIPQFDVPDLRYSGSRFVHNRDKKRYRKMRLDPWGEEPVRE